MQLSHYWTNALVILKDYVCEKSSKISQSDTLIVPFFSHFQALFWGIVGIISGLIAALADVPLVKPGRLDPDTAVLKGKIQIVSIILLMTLKKMKVKIIGPLGVGYMLFAILLIIAGVG